MADLDSTSGPLISVLMLTHNAPKYVEISIRTLAENTKDVRYELVVVDNASETETRELVKRLYDEGLIHKLKLLDYNSLFAEGNNIAAEMADPDADYFLLLNSDVKVKRPDWLSNLLRIHRGGITAYGAVMHDPIRADGYCLLIDARLYRDHRLDVGHQWWWSVTKLQGQLVAAGVTVQALAEHEDYLHHFGGKSGDAFKTARGMETTREEVRGWFGDGKVVILDEATAGRGNLLTRIKRKLRG